ncbi:translation initiation factor IF-2, partial [Klebsiella pneumoniae]|nr:translation initiation factor IF-2 [Klebsiella pneumoniae]
MYSIPERLKEDNDLYRKMLSSLATNLRVAMPGIIESYDPATQTATIQTAIREKVNINGNQEWTNIPLLVDVPILFP